MKAIDRLYKYFDFKGIKPTKFEKENKISNGYFGITLKRKADIGSSIVEKVINSCRDLNIRWLMTGEGEMITSKQDNPIGIDYSRCPFCKEKEKLILNQAERILELKETIAILQNRTTTREDEDTFGKRQSA